MVMTAAAQDGWALEYATEELRGDREVVMTAVAQAGGALQYATEELRGDRDVVMTAIASLGWAVEHASEELRGDREVMEAALADAASDETPGVPVGLKARLSPACLLFSLIVSQRGRKSPATSGALCTHAAILDNPQGL